MSETIFFLWQADTDPKIGRNLINRVLNRAVGSIGSDATVDEAVRNLSVDRDGGNMCVEGAECAFDP